MALSRGNRQKVGLVQTFMHDPELLVLDEPTTGLDPHLRARAVTRIEVTFAVPPAPEAFAAVANVCEVERRRALVVFDVRGEIDAFVKTLAQHRILALNSHEADLEDVFLSLYRGEERRAAA